MICRKLEECVLGELKGTSVSKCDNERKRCIKSSDTRSSVSCSEKGKTYILENTAKKLIIHYCMDNGIITVDKSVPEGTGKCDRLYIIEGETPTAILIELKGKASEKALQQLKSVLELYDPFFKKCENVYVRAVVTGAVPKLRAKPSYTNLARHLKSNYKGNIKIAERQFSEKDTELSVSQKEKTK